MNSELRPSEAGRLLGVSASTIRSWEKRGLLPQPLTRRTAGGHLRIDRRAARALRMALDEGLIGSTACRRAAQLVSTGRCDDSPRLHERMTQLEAEIRMLRDGWNDRLEELIGQIGQIQQSNIGRS